MLRHTSGNDLPLTDAEATDAELIGQSVGTFVTKAWAVDRTSAGTVTFTFSTSKMFSDPQGLQRALRADGVAAFVQVHREDSYVKGADTVYYDDCAYQGLQAEPPDIQHSVLTPNARDQSGQESWTVHPAAMPGGSSMLIAIWPSDIGAIGLSPMVLATSQPPACVPAPPPN